MINELSWSSNRPFVETLQTTGDFQAQDSLNAEFDELEDSEML